ncbi:MAG: M48 family metallopeptidase [Flavobacteriaceae bacterium]|nr:M48 family metallopeptidase [Flavobacteriaceae bacterium]
MANYTAKGESLGKQAHASVDAGGLTINCGHRHIVWQAAFIHKKIERKQGNYVFQFGDSPAETLETSEKLLVIHFLKQHKKSGHYLQGQRNTIWLKGMLLLLGILVILHLLVYFYLLPRMADEFVKSIPIEQEQKLGEEIFSQMSDMNEDVARSKVLNAFFAKLHYQTPYKPKLHLVKDEVVNAYATPGSHIVVTMGILSKMKSSKELSALLAHELSHINCRHITRSLCRNLGSWALLSVAVGDIGGLSGRLLQGGAQLRTLSFSREFEEEADHEGFAQLIKQGIDPNGMVNLFQKLQQDQTIDVAEFISTHPDLKSRIEYTKQKIAKSHSVFLPTPTLDSIFEKLQNW